MTTALKSLASVETGGALEEARTRNGRRAKMQGSASSGFRIVKWLGRGTYMVGLVFKPGPLVD